MKRQSARPRGTAPSTNGSDPIENLLCLLQVVTRERHRMVPSLLVATRSHEAAERPPKGDSTLDQRLRSDREFALPLAGGHARTTPNGSFPSRSNQIT